MSGIEARIEFSFLSSIAICMCSWSNELLLCLVLLGLNDFLGVTARGGVTQKSGSELILVILCGVIGACDARGFGPGNDLCLTDVLCGGCGFLTSVSCQWWLMKSSNCDASGLWFGLTFIIERMSSWMLLGTFVGTVYFPATILFIIRTRFVVFQGSFPTAII